MVVTRALTFAALFALALLVVLGVAGRAQDRAAPVRATVQVPLPNAATLTLEVGIRLAALPAGGHPGAVVRLLGSAGAAMEVGRLTLMPSAASGPQRFQFNISDAVRRLGLAGRTAEVEIEPIDRAGGVALSPLAIEGARVVTRQR